MKKAVAFLMSLIIAFSLPVSVAAVEAEEDAGDSIRDMVTEITEAISEEPDSSEQTTLPEEPSTEPEPPAPSIVYYGDINKDFKVTAADARAILRFSAKLITFTKEQCVIADIDKDTAVASSDARKALRIAARLDAPTPFDVAVSDPDTVYTSYDLRPTYKAELSGFSTNIRDAKVFDKIKALEKYVGTQKQRVTFYYTDVQGQYYIQYNSNKVFRTQCTIKAPYVKSILVYMEKNNISPEKKLQLHSSQKWSGHYCSGFASGSWISIRDWIYYAIRLSDNTAYQVLFDYFGAGVFNESSKNAGASLRLGTYIFGETSASDMAKLFLDIYKYNGKYKNILFEDMKNASHNTDMIGRGVPKNITFIHKFGNGASLTTGLHDCAVIYTKVPCVLVIFTSLNAYGDYSRLQFGEIASKVVDVNQNVTYY